MAFTEFYCNPSTGSNLNSGSTEAAAVFTGVGDSDGTSVFTPSDGQTPASTVSAGMFGSVYVTSGATVAVFVGRITVVAAGVNGAVTFSTTAKGGTFPSASSGAHTITMVVGGPWKGPNSAVGFPFGFFTSTMTDASSNQPRCNLKNNATYSITAAITDAIATGNSRLFQGYTTTAGDLGRATIDGGTSGVSYVLLTASGTGAHLVDLIFQNNGASAAANLVTLSSGDARNLVTRCVFGHGRGSGLSVSGQAAITECEAYDCNQSNTASMGGFLNNGSGPQTLVRCIAHDNTGSNTGGFFCGTGQTSVYFNCIADTNAGGGFAGGGNKFLYGCVAYGNTGPGVSLTGTSRVESTIMATNSTYGLAMNSAAALTELQNNAYFGNTTLPTSLLGGVTDVGAITLASLPFVDAPNGDFRINLASAKGAGRGTFTETATSYAGTIGYPDVGAAQHLESSAVIVIDDE